MPDLYIYHNYLSLCSIFLQKMKTNYAGADDALMLDLNGFVAETNACNVFMIKARYFTYSIACCMPAGDYTRACD